MPHLITIIKYELNIVKYILAAFCRDTVAALRQWLQNEAILSPTRTEQSIYTHFSYSTGPRLGLKSGRVK